MCIQFGNMLVKLKKIDHIGIIVASSDESIKFYTEVLGMNLKGKAKSEVTGDTYTHLVLEKEGSLDSHLELVEVSDKSPLAKVGLAKKGLSHIAYQVDDVESAIKKLNTAGCETVLPPTKIGDIKFAYVKVKDGYVFEIMEIPEKYDNSYQVPP